MRLFQIIFFFVFHFVIAQNYEVKLYNYKNGFPANKVFDLVEDSSNTIWLGTDKGLVRFDGSNFVKIELKKYSDKPIRKLKIYYDCLYVIYFNGNVNEINLNNYKNKSLLFSDVNDLSVHKDTTWVLHSKGILSMQAKKSHVYNLNTEKFPIVTYGCIEHYNNKLFISLPKKGIYSFQPQKNKLSKLNRKGQGYYEDFIIKNNDLYFIRTKTPQKFDNQKQKFESILLDNYFKGFISDYTIYRNNVYFISDNRSFYKKGSQVNKLYEAKDVELIKVIVQPTNFYFATNKGLLSLTLKDNSIVNYNSDKESNDNYIRVRRKIISSNDSIILFGFPHINLLRAGNITKITNSIASNYDAIKYKGGYLSCNEGNGIVFYFNNFKKIKNIKIPSYNYLDEGDFTSIFHDVNKKQVFIGNKKYVYILNENLIQIAKIQSPFVNFSIKQIIKYNKDAYLIGTDSGVFKLNSKKEIYPLNLLNGKIVGDIVVDKKEGLLFVGHEKGIDVLTTQQLKHKKSIYFTELLNPKIATILIDSQQRIWCATYSGILCYDYKKDKKVFLDYTNGLLNYEYNYKCAAKISPTEFIFGGLEGYDLICTSKIATQGVRKKGEFTGVNLFSRTDTLHLPASSKITYRGEDYYCKIYFSPPQKSELNKCRFKYALNDGQWISLSDKTSIDLIGLGTDNYLLKLEGVDQFGNRIIFPNLEINITQSLYKSDNFVYFILLLLLSLVLFIAYKIIKTKKDKLKIYDEISMDLHDEVGNVLTHLMLLVKSKSDLNEIKDKVIEQLMAANFGLRVFINTTINKQVSLEEFNDELLEELSKILLYHKITFNSIDKYNVKRKINATLARDLKLILFEIINNSVKHAKATTIDYKLIASKHAIQITVKDDGIGFDSSNTFKGKGLKNIQKRVSFHKGELELSSSDDGTQYVITLRQ